MTTMTSYKAVRDRGYTAATAALLATGQGMGQQDRTKQNQLTINIQGESRHIRTKVGVQMLYVQIVICASVCTICIVRTTSVCTTSES